MGYLYAIYIYRFLKKNDYGDWTLCDQAREADMSLAQDVFYGIFSKKKNTVFPVREERDSDKKYQCKVYGNDHRIVALRLQNEKEEHYWEEEADPNDPMGKVKRKTMLSRPPTFVIIDCRPGCNVLAVRIDTDAWRSPNTVRDLMETSINLYLESLSAGFRVQLLTKMHNHDFISYSRLRIKKEGRGVKEVTIRLKTGKTNPQVEAMVKTSPYLRKLLALIEEFSDESGEVKFHNPSGPKFISRRRDIETLITLIAGDPKGYALAMTFDDDMTLRCGKDVRADLAMNPEGALELFHLGRKMERAKQLELNFDGTEEQDHSKYYLEGWLDYVAEETNKMKDAETVKRKGGRANRRKVS